VAARRLLIVLLLLLAASVAAAALAPDRTSQLLSTSDSSTTTTSTTTTTADPPGGSLSERIDASVEKPQTVDAFVGDQLELSVGIASGPGRTIAIEQFGVTEFAAPEAPAHFDLLLREQGYYAVTDERGEVVGRIQVRLRGSEPVPPGSAGGEDT
jgi:hypothetical protein